MVKASNQLELGIGNWELGIGELNMNSARESKNKKWKVDEIEAPNEEAVFSLHRRDTWLYTYVHSNTLKSVQINYFLFFFKDFFS